MWDTGATNTVVSTKIIKSLGLKPAGYCEVATADTKEHKKAYTYYVDIGLIDLKHGQTVIEIIEEDMKDDVLIGIEYHWLRRFCHLQWPYFLLLLSTVAKCPEPTRKGKIIQHFLRYTFLTSPQKVNMEHLHSLVGRSCQHLKEVAVSHRVRAITACNY